MGRKKAILIARLVAAAAAILFAVRPAPAQDWFKTGTGLGITKARVAAPDTVARFVETPQFDGPLGARGIGELSMISVASAISNAIYRSIGVKLNNLPMSPEEVWRAISEQKPELLAKAMESYGRLETEVRVRP